jgi:hypothetical protein
VGLSSQQTTLVGVPSCEPGRKETRSRRHSASVVFPVNEAEATLAKQAHSSVNTATISERVLEKSKLAQHAYEDGKRVP